MYQSDIKSLFMTFSDICTMYMCHNLTAILHHCFSNSKVFFCFPFTWYEADSYKQTRFLLFITHKCMCPCVFLHQYVQMVYVLTFFVETGYNLEEKNSELYFRYCSRVKVRSHKHFSIIQFIVNFCLTIVARSLKKCSIK